MKKLRIKRTIQICGYIALCSIFEWAQRNEEPVKEGITLADLGVAEEQIVKIDAM